MLTVKQIRESRGMNIERDTSRATAFSETQSRGIESVLSAYREQQEELARLQKEKQERQKRMERGEATKEDLDVITSYGRGIAANRNIADMQSILERNEIISAPQKRGFDRATGTVIPPGGGSYLSSLRGQLTSLADKIPLLQPLFGSSQSKRFLDDESSLLKQIKGEGIVGVLFNNLLMPPEEKVTRDYESLVRSGVDKATADKLASWRHGFADADYKPTALQLDTLRDASLERGIWSMLELLDAVTLGRVSGVTGVIRSGLLGAEKTALSKTLAEATSRTQMRDALIERYPQLKGTQELERIIDLGQKIHSNPIAFDSEISASARAGRQVLQAEAIADTAAQQALYRTGTPALRTVAGTAEDALVARQGITAALRGEREALRLSQPDVLASEIKSGSIPLKTTADDTIEVFSIGRRTGIGEQVTPVKELATDGARSFKVAVDDLVRLDDGTFTYIPKKQLSNDLTPSIKAIRDTRIQREVAEREARQKLEREAKIKAAKQARKVAEEARVARETAEKAEKERVEQVVKQAADIKPKQITEARRTMVGAIKEIAKVQKAEISLQKKIIDLVGKTRQAHRTTKGVTPNRLEKTFAEYLTSSEKLKLRSGKDLTEKQWAGVRKRIIKARNEQRDILATQKKTAQETARTMREEMKRMSDLKKEAEKYVVPKKTARKKTQTVEAVDNIPKELRPLVEEAKKYKSAEEFVRAQEGNILQHASDNPNLTKFEDLPLQKKTFASKVSRLNELKAEQAKLKTSDELVNWKNADEYQSLLKEFSFGDRPLKTGMRGARGGDGVYLTSQVDLWRATMADQGTPLGKYTYDVLITNPDKVRQYGQVAGGGNELLETVIKNNEGIILGKTGKYNLKSQLTDIWKHATRKTESEQVTPSKLKPIGKGEQTESTLSRRLIKTAKEQSKDVPPDIATPFYNKATNSEYIKQASEYLTKHGIDDSIDAIMDIADDAVPQQIKPALYNAILDTVQRSGTPEQIQRMVSALSRISEEGTAAGQIVESLKALHQNNPVMRIIELQKTLKTEVTRKLGKKAIEQTEKELTERFAKVGSKEDATSVVDDLTC